MNLLVDTHIILWWLEDSDSLPATARALLMDTGHVCMVSSASVWEIAIKSALGLLQVPASYLEELRAEGFQELPVSWHHAEATDHLPDIHRDPFDRLLVAQALLENLTIVTADRNILKYDAPALQ